MILLLHANWSNLPTILPSAVIMLAAAPFLAWLVQDSLRSGSSITPWGFDATRQSAPWFYWFDILTYGLFAALALMGGSVAMWRSIIG